MDRSVLSILLLILCSNSITKVIGEDAVSNSAEYNQKFNDLNAGDIAIIFDQISANELFRLATSDVTNPRITSFFVEIFRRRFQNYSILTSDYGRYSREHSIIVDDSQKLIKITDLEMVTKIFNAFGSTIKILGITREFAKQVLESMTASLDGVNNLFVGIAETEQVHSQPLTYLFPNIRELTLKLESDTDFSYIDYVYPKLEALDLRLYSLAWNQRDQIEGLMQKNPQILNLTLVGHVSDYLESINEYLPNLQSLVIEKFYICEGAVQFNNLKHFYLRSKSNSGNYYHAHT